MVKLIRHRRLGPIALGMPRVVGRNGAHILNDSRDQSDRELGISICFRT
jgi:hypothetical protein